MLSKRMSDALNQQVNAELYSAYIYLSMASYLDEAGLPGFAHWMKKQYGEEVEHAMKFYEYINDRSARVVLKAIEQPPVDFKSPLEVFEAALEHEKKVTGMINSLVDIADAEKDKATRVFLHWFVNEQVEEEKSVSDVIGALKLAGDTGHALLMLDKQLGGR
jgi:ferritin